LLRLGHIKRSFHERESEKTRFGERKPGFLIALQKRKWLWRLIASILLMSSLVFVTAVTAYITMVVSVKGEETSVPKLMGMTTTEAVQVLSEQDLKLRIIEKRQYSKGVEEGRVIRQEPEPGISIKRNSAIRVTLSAGTRTIVVPSLIGQSARNAASVFSRNGLNLHTISQTHSNQVVMNNIIAQEPSPGTEVVRGSRVNILVSLGPREKFFVMPDLIGKEYEIVSNQLTRGGFRIGNTFYRNYPGVRRDIVIMQYPKAGYSVSKTDIINLWISE